MNTTQASVGLGAALALWWARRRKLDNRRVTGYPDGMWVVSGYRHRPAARLARVMAASAALDREEEREDD